jgi:hypothetical protein
MLDIPPVLQLYSHNFTGLETKDIMHIAMINWKQKQTTKVSHIIIIIIIIIT